MSDIYNPPVPGNREGLPHEPAPRKLGRLGLKLSLIAPVVIMWMIVFPPG